MNVFKRCGLKAIVTEASGGDFSKEFSHEFQVLAQTGEDNIIYCPKGNFAQNVEVAKVKAGDNCPNCSAKLESAKSIEAGNIFTLGTKYSKALGALFTDQQGKRQPIIMGCYGLGISRLMGTIAEVLHDEQGIIWPLETAPFQVHLIALHKTEKQADKIYQEMVDSGIEVLYDDRENKSAGQKFAEADLLGIPIRMVVSEKTLEEQSVEVKKRGEEKTELVKIEKVNEILK